MIVYTIGFTKTTAENFFSRLKKNNVKRVVDVRLKTDSQLSGFAKRRDLSYFLNEILAVSYEHEKLLAPELHMLDAYKKKSISWHEYEEQYVRLLDQRNVGERIKPESLEGACFLCSEDKPHHCHRRVAAEYLNRKWGSILEIRHL